MKMNCSRVRSSRRLVPASDRSCDRDDAAGLDNAVLTVTVQCGLPKESYLAFDHPLQRAIRHAVAHFTSSPEERLVAGIDGCSAPNYAVPLACSAGFARLAADEADADYGNAPRSWPTR